MYAHILLPLDGTRLAEQALPYVALVARRTGAQVHLATVRPHSGLAPSDLPDMEPPQHMPEEYLAAVAGRLREAGVDNVSATVLTGPEIPRALEEHRQQIGGDVTVMCSHGRGPARRAWMGSVTDAYARMSAAPILVVRARPDSGAASDPSADVGFRRVLIPIDGSPLSLRALQPAVELTRPDGAAYTLVRLSEPPRALGSWWFPAGAEMTEQQLATARSGGEDDLEVASRRMTSLGADARTMFAFVDHVPEGILACAREQEASLIAMATHGRGGLRRLTLGSTADKVLRAAECPVLIVRPEPE